MSAQVDLPLEHARVEPRASTGGRAPAVVLLHGRGADEEDLLPLASRLPDVLHVISFRAPDPLMMGYTWYELDVPGDDLHRSQPEPDDFRRSLDLVTESIDGAIEAYDLNPDRIGLFGFSQGAITSFALLLEDPARYAWCVGLHGYLADSHTDRDPDGVEGFPVFVGAGRDDEIIPATRGEAAANRLREVGCDVTFRVYDSGHGVGSDEMADVEEWVSRRVE